MIASELISQILAPLGEGDTGEEALTIMQVYHVKHLPIVKNNKILGTLSEEIILNNDLEAAVGKYQLRTNDAFVKNKDHLFEVMSKMAKSRLTVIPVIDDNEDFVGLITQEDILQYYANSFSFAEPGSIIVLETLKSNYSLSQIAQIVESEGVVILNSFITSEGDSNTIFVTLKVNKRNVQSSIAALERYEYKVKASFTESDKTDGLKERYDSLMKYLSV